MNKFKKHLGLAIFGSMFAMGSVANAATNTFEGNTFGVTYGVSNGGSNPLFPIFQADVTGSASAIEVANAAGWTVDTAGSTLSLTWNKGTEFMNSGSPAFIGFKITDTANQLTDFLGATIMNTTYMPSTYGNLVEGFMPSQITFDANNIYINLNTAMWHAAPMASMGDPFRDQIALSVNLAPIPEPETYAMLLAGLGLMGAVVRRRQGQQGK